MQIPLYQSHAQTSTQVAATPMSSDAASATGRAVAGLGEKVGAIAGDYQARFVKEEAEAQVAQYTVDRKIRHDAMSSELASLTDPEEIESVYSSWRESEEEIFNTTPLNKRSKSAIRNNNILFYGDSDVATNGRIRKAKVNVLDRTYIDIQNLAYNNETDSSIMNEDGSTMSPSELFEYATMKRVALGHDYEDAVKSIRGFDQVVESRQISKQANVNPDIAKDMLDNSSQPPQNVALLEKTIQDGFDKREKKIITYQSGTSKDLNGEYKSRNLTRTRVDGAKNETTNIMGVETPSITESEGDALIAALDAQEISDMDMVPALFDGIADGWKSMFKSANKDKFNSKSFDKIMGQIGAKQKRSNKPILPKGTIESQLNFVQDNLYTVAEGMSLNSGTTEGLVSIVDTLATVNNSAPANTRDNIKAMNSLIQSYMESVKENGGQMNEAQIMEWRKGNMGKELGETARIKARESYRVGEPVKPGVTPLSGVVFDDYEGVSNYRFIGSGQFERID